MIRLLLDATSELDAPYVVRLGDGIGLDDAGCAVLVDDFGDGAVYAGSHGLLEISGLPHSEIGGDVVLVQPATGRAERLIRRGSDHNTLLVTERCDQLCVMCSQPPKKTHVDRFQLLEEACLLADPGTLIGVSGGEPTLYKDQLLGMVERVLTARPDLGFHILSNGQHFGEEDIVRLRQPLFEGVSWGIPLYAADPAVHDEIVGKVGAFSRLEESLAVLIMAGARVELRTVLVRPNLTHLAALSHYVAARLGFVEAWSIMQLENIGFARRRWNNLFVEHWSCFSRIAEAIDYALLHGVRAQLFNFPLCTVPEPYRSLAAPSISDWKKKFAGACEGCTVQQSCSGFFEWHSDELANRSVRPL